MRRNKYIDYYGKVKSFDDKQNLVHIAKRTDCTENNFLIINRTTLGKACNNIFVSSRSVGAVFDYLYLAGNVDGWIDEFSPQNVSNEYGISLDAARDGFKVLVKLGYIVNDSEYENEFTFYRSPVTDGEKQIRQLDRTDALQAEYASNKKIKTLMKYAKTEADFKAVDEYAEALVDIEYPMLEEKTQTEEPKKIKSFSDIDYSSELELLNKEYPELSAAMQTATGEQWKLLCEWKTQKIKAKYGFAEEPQDWKTCLMVSP